MIDGEDGEDVRKKVELEIPTNDKGQPPKHLF